ncbi:MAG: TonB-dependent receptor plug domain-containing protein, partial [Afipia sp.]|nr:TonB-dependent receptor plug domain-containing protein [Afipia sp.]
MRRLKGIFAGTAVVAVMAVPTAAWAQEAEPAVGDEIVVTAQKREQRLIDVPSAVTAVSGDALTQRNLTRIEQFAAFTPGISFSEGVTGPQLTVRGLNASGQGATTAILVDDVPLTSSSSYQQSTTPNFDTYDLERIEVLRGPQGTLYGASALGGLVKYVTKAPNLSRVEGSAQLELNHVDDGETGGSVRAALNLPVVQDSVAIRVSGLYERLPGYIDNPLGNKRNVNSGERYGVRGALLWQAGPDFSVRLSGIWQRDDRDAPASIDVVGAALTPATPPANATSIANGGELQRNLRLGEPIKRKSQLYSATLNYDAGFASFTSITSLAKMNFQRRKILTHYNAAPGVTFGDVLSGAYGQPVDIRGNDFTTVRRINQEIRLASAPDSGPIDYLVGLFYTDEKSSITQLFDVTSVTTPPEILTLPVPGGGVFVPARYREVAGFAQLTWHVLPTV